MVAIAPFRGLRYNLSAVGEFGRVVAPPYDVISPEQQDQLYQTSPYNVVRLIFGKQFPDDHEASNRYTRAKETFEAWQRERVLIRDERPRVYAYEHAFQWGGSTFRRLGFIALMRFDDPAHSQICPHENTFEAPKADRTKLLDAVHTQLDPVFCLFPDAECAIDGSLRQAVQASCPVASARIPATTSGGAGDGEEEIRLWAIDEERTIRELQRLIAPVKVLIADGHHRFQVALSRRRTCEAVMTFFARLEDPAVAIRPIHRVMRGGPQAQQALKALCILEPAATCEALFRWLEDAASPGTFGLYTPQGSYRARLRPEVLARWQADPAVPKPLAELDVTILHQIIAPALLSAHGTGQQAVRYTPHPAQAIAMVDRHEGDWAWWLRPLSTSRVFSLAQQGLTLPQKSTYFYPKVISGLAMNPCDS